MTLKDRLRESKERYEDLKAKSKRKMCPDINSHEEKTKLVVDGYTPTKISGFPSQCEFGYQISICLICNEWIARKYNGDEPCIVSKEVGERMFNLQLSP